MARKQLGVDPRVAALRERESEAENAWKSEFQQALQRAALHLPSTKPRTRADKRALAEFIRPLKELLRGRPRGVDPDDMRPADRIRVAERVAALKVRVDKMKWCRENDSSRVPKRVTADFIKDRTKEASIECKVPEAKIGKGNIRTLLGNE
jgi:hypothetical protein